MADIRINALATTATTPASDDYLALDGAAQGTRKILATNIANNVTDVILGSSGPSVKSTLSARAPRQGLVFNGTAGATTSVPALGTADYTFAIWINPTSLSTSEKRLLGSDGIGAFEVQIDRGVAGSISVIKSNVGAVTTTGALLSAGKLQLVTITRTSTSGVISINGVQAATFTDSQNYTAVSDKIGSILSPASYYNGTLIGPLVYNRALSASEVVALYEAGAPAGADYNSASNTNISADTFVNGTGAATFSGASATAFTISGTTGGAAGTAGRAVYGTDLGASLRIGTKYRVTFSATITSGEAPIVAIGHSGTGYASNQVTVTNGTNTLELTIDTTRASNRLLFVSSPSTAINYSVSSLVWTRIGLLLAPDAAQAGGGLVWYDTSGNAANITLPASGVSWNVPFGNNIAASGTNQNLTLNASGTGSILLGSNGVARGQIAGVNKNGSTGPASSGTTTNGIWRVSNVSNSLVLDVGLQGNASPYPGYIQVSDYSNLATSYPLSLNPNGGVVLVNTTANSGNGAIQLATHTTSAGGIGFGTATSIWTAGSGSLRFGDSTNTAQIAISGSGVYIGASAGASGNTIITSGSGATALTLDSSQNATFAGSRITLGGSGNGEVDIRRATNSNGSSVAYRTTSTLKWYHGLRGLVNDNWYLQNEVAGNTALFFDAATSDATFGGKITTSAPTGGAGAWELGVYSATAPTATGYVTIEIGGVQYKLLAST